ncbi:MAG: hypothetical protein U5J63_09500 [Fodinibius sp.]|nr:hypothetical protein [Fodinibius sp.]
MSELLDLDNLSQRIHGYIDLRAQGILTDEKKLKEESKYILTETMLRGEISRRDAKRVTGLSERSARRVLSTLEDEQLVISKNHKSPVRFNIPPKVIGYYFPDLYPEGRISRSTQFTLPFKLRRLLITPKSRHTDLPSIPG